MLTLRRIASYGRRDIGSKATIRGWVRTLRHQGDFSFMNVTDGSSVAGIQVVFERKDLDNYDEVVDLAKTGASIEAVGEIVESPAKGQEIELRAGSVKIIGDAPSDYPLQKKRHTLAFLRSIPHLRARTNTIAAVTRIRNLVIRETHRFFQENGFYLISTPIITASDCEGAGEMFRVTTLDPTREWKDFSEDFFGRPAFLTVSGQLELETYACAMGNVYTFGPAFRAENSNTTRHLAEFWMVEPEMAFCDLDGDIEVASNYLKHLAQKLLEEAEADIAFFERFYEKDLGARIRKIAEKGFERISYTEAIEILKKSGRKFEFPVEWGRDLQSEHERYLTEKHFNGVVVVTDYPRSIKAFYMKDNADGRTVAAMDVLAPGVGEIIGGSQREDSYDVLKGKIEEFGLNPSDYSWYLDLRRYGTVPHAGFGLGIERAVQLFTGMENIRDVIPFPRYPGHV